MKNLIIFCLACISLTNSYAQDNFWYFRDGRHYFNVSSNKFVVKIDENIEESAIKSSFQQNASLKISDISAMNGNEFKLMRFYDNSRSSISRLANQLMNDDAVLFVGYVIVDENGRKTAAFTNQINVMLKNDDDFPILLEAIASFDINKVRQLEFNSRRYLLTVSYYSEKTALQIANELHRTGLFQFSEPDLILFIRYAAGLTNPILINDPHSYCQWGFNSLVHGWGIKAQQAWTITAGSPDIKIAVLDTGVDLNHPSLRENLLPGFNAVTGNEGIGAGAPPAPHILLRSHGTAVAGIVAARSIRLFGVAHNARILPVSLGSATYAHRVEAEISWAIANGARVINMSFRVCDILDTVSTALDAATAKEIVLVACSYNQGLPNVTFPASHPDVIAVGAIDNQGRRAVFSNYGLNLDVVAPGVNIFTTGLLPDPAIEKLVMNNLVNIVGDEESGIYFFGMNGTSFAAPAVAGVAALILSVRPDLTALQVRNAIKYTANRNLPGWILHENRPNGAWNYYFGYGLVDAYAAVLKVLEMCSTIFINQVVTASDTIVCYRLNVRNVTITNGATLMLAADGNIYISNITIAENSRLILSAGNEIIIDGYFDIHLGAEFEIK